MKSLSPRYTCGLIISILLTPVLAGGSFASDQEKQKYWVYFADKGPIVTSQAGKLARQSLSPRAVQRRILRGKPGAIFDTSDLPVYKEYIREVEQYGVEICRRSRWLNAISVWADPVQTEQLRELTFTGKIEPVAIYVREPLNLDQGKFDKSGSGFGISGLDYGASLNQIQLSNIAPLHDEGLSGQGILIALLDSGYFYEQHQALQHLDIVAEHDFIFNDDTTKNEDGDASSQHNHGTWVLSVVGGFLPGTLIGPAYGAEYALAKTEFIPTETRIEEDNWVAAVEWSDSLGADIISSSLGYLIFDNGVEPYTYDDLDGRSMVTSIAASMAVAKGIVVVISAGNEGNVPDWPYVWSPADGIGVIAVGAVNSQGIRSSFSSIGPTADNRIKPDVMAMGSAVIAADPRNSTGTVSLLGTSLSAPIVAGICALMLEKIPALTPGSILTALTETASQAGAPNNLMGYGIANAAEAASYFESIQIPSRFAIHPSSINSALTRTTFFIDMPETAMVSVSIFNPLGQQVGTIEEQVVAGTKKPLLWNWPSYLANGVYFARFRSPTKEGIQKTIVLR